MRALPVTVSRPVGQLPIQTGERKISPSKAAQRLRDVVERWPRERPYRRAGALRCLAEGCAGPRPALRANFHPVVMFSVPANSNREAHHAHSKHDL